MNESKNITLNIIQDDKIVPRNIPQKVIEVIEKLRTVLTPVSNKVAVVLLVTLDACFPATLCAWTALEISSSRVEICDEMPTTDVSSPSSDDSGRQSE